MTRDVGTVEPLLPDVIRAVARGEPRLPESTRVSRTDLEWLVRGGQGPLLHRLRPSGGYRGAPGTDDVLRGADLTSRVLTGQLSSAVEEVIATLSEVGCAPTLLKGIAHASRYYPEPHLRIMGDVDLLVPRNRTGRAIEALTSLGYRPKPEAGDSLHHAPPLRHPDRGVIVELHHALLPPTTPAARTPPLDLGVIEEETRSGMFGSTVARYLSPEVDLMLLAAGWCRDLREHLGLSGSTPRPLVDAAHLLRRSDDLDWDRVTGWSDGTYAGACLAVLVGYLGRLGAWTGPADIPQRLVEGQVHVRRTSLRLIHAIFDRAVVRCRGPRQLVSTYMLENALDALLAPRAAWRNIVSVPSNVAFPRREPRRFQPRFVLRRITAPFRPR